MIDTDHYIKLCYELEDGACEISVPWATGGTLILRDKEAQIFHNEDDSTYNFSDQYLTPFKDQPHCFDSDGNCKCGAHIHPTRLLSQPFVLRSELIHTGATEYCKQFLFEQALHRLCKIYSELSELKIRVNNHVCDNDALIRSIDNHTKIFQVMES